MPRFVWALLLLLTLCLPEILVKGFFFKILSPTFAVFLKHGHMYSKKYSFEVFSKKNEPYFSLFPENQVTDARSSIHRLKRLASVDQVLFTVVCLCFFCYMVSSKKMLSELIDLALINDYGRVLESPL